MANSLLVTDLGSQAISNALANGTTVQPKTFKFITPIMAITSSMTKDSINAIDVWHEATITEYDISDQSTVSFNCIVEANIATAKTGTVGLYLADGTLFAICALDSQLPINQRQGVYMRINYNNSVAAFDFNFLSVNDYLHENSKQALDFNNAISVSGNTVTIHKGDGTSQSIDLNNIDAATLNGSTKQQIIDYILGGASAAYDTLLELQNEIQANDGDIASILNTLSLKLNTSAYTASDVLAKLLTVDGASSGLEADKVPGYGIGAYKQVPNNNFNDAVIGGMYFGYAPNHPTTPSTNAPGTSNGSIGLYVSGVIGSGWCSQIAVDTTTGIVWTRTLASGVWSTWVKNIAESDLATLFARNLGTVNTSGYFKIPAPTPNDPPTIIQMGTAVSTGGAMQTVNLPITFPNAIVKVIGSGLLQSDGTQYIGSASPVSASQIRIRAGGLISVAGAFTTTSGADNPNVFWIAIGY